MLLPLLALLLLLPNTLLVTAEPALLFPAEAGLSATLAFVPAASQCCKKVLGHMEHNPACIFDNANALCRQRAVHTTATDKNPTHMARVHTNDA